MVTRGNRCTMHGHSRQQVHYAWSLVARQVHYAWSLMTTGALCVVTHSKRCTMRGHSRQKVHYACSIGRHTHKTTIDAGVTDDSHSAYGSRVTGVGRGR